MRDFDSGREIFNTTSKTDLFFFCFEYEDEQGNDCNTITLAAGEERNVLLKIT